MVAAPCLAQAQLPQYDYDVLYDELLASFDQEQPVQARAQAHPVQARAQAHPVQARAQAHPVQARFQAQAQTTTPEPRNGTHIAVLKDARYTDPATGAFIYDYMGADGSGKYEIRFLNGTVVGNYSYLNEEGERETRWYSAGLRGTEIAGDGVVSPAPPTLVDETTGPNYVDLSSYDHYKHLEVPYVHIAGPSDADERGQLTNPGRRPSQTPSQVPLDHGDVTFFSNQQQAAAQRQHESVFGHQAQEWQQQHFNQHRGAQQFSQNQVQQFRQQPVQQFTQQQGQMHRQRQQHAHPFHG